MTTAARSTTSSQKLKGFDNVYSLLLLWLGVIAPILIGLALIFSPGWLALAGGIFILTGVALLVTGFKRLSNDPPTAGVLHFLGEPLEINGKPAVVGGITLVPGYLGFSVVEVNITKHDKDFPVSVYSKSGTPLKGKVSVTYEPNVEDLVDYINAGNKPADVDNQIDDIVVQVSRPIAETMTSKEIRTNGSMIADAIRYRLESKSFGITVTNLQAVFDPPDDVVKAMGATEAEQFQRQAELYEYNQTNLKAAIDLQAAYESDPRMRGHVPNLEVCLQQILMQRLIRDGKATRIDGTNGIFGVTNPHP